MNVTTGGRLPPPAISEVINLHRQKIGPVSPQGHMETPPQTPRKSVLAGKSHTNVTNTGTKATYEMPYMSTWRLIAFRA